MPRLPVIVVLTTVMIDSMGIGLILPVMPALIKEVSGGDLADAALWGGVLTTIFAVMQFLFGPLLGNLSDRYGRRPILLLSLVVMAADYVVMALASSIWLLVLGRVVGGIASATQATASAYMADVSKPDEKAQAFGLIGAAFGVGFVLGPLIGGYLGEFGTRAPFWAAAILAAFNAGLGYFVLKESVTDAIRRPFDWRRANPLGAFKALEQLPGIKPALVIFFLYSVAFNVYPAIWAFFAEARFGWDSGMIGLSLALFGTSFAIVQGGLIGPAKRMLGERGMVVYGLSFDMLAFLALALVTSGTVALILTPLTALAAVVTPALQGIMSRTVGETRQGELQGALTSVAALAMIVAPLMMTSVFAVFTRDTAPVYFPGAPFGLALVLVGAALAVFLIYGRRVAR